MALLKKAKTHELPVSLFEEMKRKQMEIETPGK
jgi:hypothetical protein